MIGMETDQLVAQIRARSRPRGSIDPVVNYIIDKEERVIHTAECDRAPTERIVTAEDLNPAYVNEHGYTLCACLSEKKP